MQTLDDKLGLLTKKTAKLWQNVSVYMGALRNLGALQGMSFDGSSMDFPFVDAIRALEMEVESLHSVLAAKDVNGAYVHAEPVFRLKPFKERGLSLDNDAISKYMQDHQMMVMWNGLGKLGDMVISYKELFLKHLISGPFSTHVFLAKEPLKRAGPEVEEYSRDYLRNLQVMYNFDVQGAFESYRDLLLDVHSSLSGHTSNIPLYVSLQPRRIPKTDESTVSNFLSQHSISGFFGVDMLQHIRRMKAEVKDGDAFLLSMLTLAPDWGEVLEDVAEYLYERNKDPLERFKIFEPTHDGIVPAETEYIERRHIIGQKHNLERLSALFTAFANGDEIPFILLKGDTGTGKSMSVKSLIYETDGLKTVLLHSGYLGGLGNYARKMAEKPWRTVLYIDDMGFSPQQFEGFKTSTQGMKKFPCNIAVVASANDESYTRLPDAVKRRFPIVLEYKKPNLSNKSTQREVFEANCSLLGIKYSDNLPREFPTRTGKRFNSASPADVYSFLVEMKAIKAAEPAKIK